MPLDILCILLATKWHCVHPRQLRAYKQEWQQVIVATTKLFIYIFKLSDVFVEVSTVVAQALCYSIRAIIQKEHVYTITYLLYLQNNKFYFNIWQALNHDVDSEYWHCTQPMRFLCFLEIHVPPFQPRPSRDLPWLDFTWPDLAWLDVTWLDLT